MSKPATREAIKTEIAFLKRKRINHTTTVEIAVDDLIEHLGHELRALDVVEAAKTVQQNYGPYTSVASTAWSTLDKSIRRFREGS